MSDFDVDLEESSLDDLQIFERELPFGRALPEEDSSELLMSSSHFSSELGPDLGLGVIDLLDSEEGEAEYDDEEGPPDSQNIPDS
jgi:hypothetical protein